MQQKWTRAFLWGRVFIPSSAALLLATLGALIAGWRTPIYYRISLALSPLMILAVLILTVTEFWPRNVALWRVARGAPDALRDHDAIIKMVHDWVVLDWARVASGCVGFLASIRAISVPFPSFDGAHSDIIADEGRLRRGACGVLVFIVYFVSKL